MPVQHDMSVRPPAPHSKLWRYMDVTKLASLLATSSLFFARADCFSDDWEGQVSSEEFEAWKDKAAGEADTDRLIQNYRRFFSGVRRHTYISCWHRNDGESAAMWKLYLKSDEGVAVRSSFARLRRQMDRSPRLISIGKVEYRDYKRKPVPGARPIEIGSAFVVGGHLTFFSKRAGFAHEREVRALFQDRFKTPDDPSEASGGLPVPVDTEDLIEAIYVAPKTPTWLRDAVQSLLDKFGVHKAVCTSEFDDYPVS